MLLATICTSAEINVSKSTMKILEQCVRNLFKEHNKDIRMTH